MVKAESEVHEALHKFRIKGNREFFQGQQDEIINILDVVQLVNIILGSVPPGSEIDAGDINNDDIINVLDIVTIVNLILGII